MDVQREFARSLRRIEGNIDAGVRRATARIENLTLTEWQEVAQGLRPSPEEAAQQRTISAWEGFGAALYSVQRGINDMLAALGRGWEQEKGKP